MDTIEHPLPRTDEVIGQMAERGVAAIPSAVAYVIIFDRLGGYFGSSTKRFSFSKDDNVRMIQRMKEAGVKMGIGTDVIFDEYRMFPFLFIVELKLFTEAGFSIAEALRTQQPPAPKSWAWTTSWEPSSVANWPMSWW